VRSTRASSHDLRIVSDPGVWAVHVDRRTAEPDSAKANIMPTTLVNKLRTTSAPPPAPNSPFPPRRPQESRPKAFGTEEDGNCTP